MLTPRLGAATQSIDVLNDDTRRQMMRELKILHEHEGGAACRPAPARRCSPAAALPRSRAWL